MTPRRPQLKATRLSARPQLKATRLSARPQLKAARLSTRPQLKATRCKNHYPGKTNSSQLPKRLSMKKRNLYTTKKNVKSICPVCPSSRSFHPALEAYLRSFGRKEPLDLALPHPSPDTRQTGNQTSS